MPQTAALFLIAAIAICGIPPFNGFVSEFIIYIGLYNWLSDATLVALLAAIFSATGLTLIGGLAMLCFTKAFGVVFLGTERSCLPQTCKEVPFLQLLPMYLLASVILLIGVFPMAFISLLARPISLFTGDFSSAYNPVQIKVLEAIQPISWASWLLILLVISIFAIRRFVMSRHRISTGPTWGCGYTAATPKIQYTAGSFVRTYSKLFAPFLLIGKHEEEVHGIFPSGGKYHTHPYDKVEKWLIDDPLKLSKSFMGRFVFLNNGKLQFYILYGVLFVLAVLGIPLIYQTMRSFIDFLKLL